MAIFRSSGYAADLVDEMQEIPKIDTPEKGEPNILDALNCVENYARNLIISSNRLTLELKNRVENAGEIALSSLKQNERKIEEFNQNVSKEFESFDKFLVSLDVLFSSFDEIDKLYNDVLYLSDLLTSLEQYVSS